MDLISIIMSTYKEPVEWVQKAVTSITNQTYRNIEIVIVIDWPENEKVVKYLENVQNEDKRIKIVRNDENIGIVKSLNKAFSVCKGLFIARMDADDVSMPCRLEKQMAFMSQERLDIVGSAYYNFENDYNTGAKKTNPRHPFICRKVLQYRNCVAHPSWLVKREVYEILDGYREIQACEDYDFLVRAELNNFRIGNTPEKLFLYRNNQNSISHKKQWEQKAIMERIGREYRKGKRLEYEAYSNYILGFQIKQDAKDIELVYSYDKTIQKYSQLKRILLSLKKTVLSRVYRKEKMINQYIKFLFWLDRKIA